jgi:hypothetical protein
MSMFPIPPEARLARRVADAREARLSPETAGDPARGGGMAEAVAARDTFAVAS